MARALDNSLDRGTRVGYVAARRVSRCFAFFFFLSFGAQREKDERATRAYHAVKKVCVITQNCTNKMRKITIEEGISHISVIN